MPGVYPPPTLTPYGISHINPSSKSWGPLVSLNFHPLPRTKPPFRKTTVFFFLLSPISVLTHVFLDFNCIL